MLREPAGRLDNAISDLDNTASGRWPPAGLGTQLAQRLGAGNVWSPLHTIMHVLFVTTGALLLLGCPCSIIGMMLLGLAVRHGRRCVCVFSLTLSVIGLLGLLGGVVATALGRGHGLAERLADYPAIVWMIAVGIFLVAASRSSRLDTLDRW